MTIVPTYAHPSSTYATCRTISTPGKLSMFFEMMQLGKQSGYSGWMGHRGQPDRLKLNRQNCTVFRIFFVLLQKVLWRYCRSNYGEKSLILFHNCTTKRKATGYQYQLYKKRSSNWLKITKLKRVLDSFQCPFFYSFPSRKYLENQAIVWYKEQTCITHFHFCGTGCARKNVGKFVPSL